MIKMRKAVEEAEEAAPSGRSSGDVDSGGVFGDEGVPAPPRVTLRSCTVLGLRKGDALPRKPMLSRYSRKASKLETAAFSGGATVGKILGHVFDDD